MQISEIKNETHPFLNEIQTRACLLIFDSFANISDCNQNSLDFFHISEKEELIKQFHVLASKYPPEGLTSEEPFSDHIKKALSGDKVDINWIFSRNDGKLIQTRIKMIDINKNHILCCIHPRYEDNGTSHEKLVTDEEQSVSLILNNIPAVCTFWDDEPKLTFCNQSAANLFGLSSPQEYLSRFSELSPILQPCGTTSMEKALIYVNQAFETGYIKFDWMHQKPDGTPIPTEVTLVRVNWFGKQGLVGFAVDMRDLHKYQAVERTVRQRLQVMLDSTPLICAIFDEYGNVLEVNNAVVPIFGLSNKQEYIDRFFELFPEYQPDGTRSSDMVSNSIKQALEAGKSHFELEHQTLDGQLIPCEVFLERVNLEDRDLIIAHGRDMRKEKALFFELESVLKMERESNKMVARLLEAAPMLVEIRNNSFNLIGCNGQVMNLFGVTSKENFIKENHKYYPEYQPCGTPSKEKEAYLLEKVMSDGYAKFEFMLLDEKGENLPLEFTYVRVKHATKTLIIGYGYDLRHARFIEKQRLEIEKESNRAKSRFLARMSHEIRTPISAILGLSEIQLRNHVMPPQTEEIFTKIYDSAKTLLNIVNDILDFSKIESGKMTLVNVKYDVASLVSDTAQLHFVYLDRKNVNFLLKVDENLPANLEGDVLRIKQIITNLLSNAFKYTESGSVTLTLQCEMNDDEHATLIITIQDTGIGMTAEQIKEIRNSNSEYMRLHEHEKPFVSGTGLGFPIMYSLVKMLNGHIELDSEKNKGTRAVVRIPQKTIGKKTLGKKLANSLQNFESGTWSAMKELEFEPISIPYGRVLVVDDIKVNLIVAEAMLEPYELNIDLCESGLDAIEKIKQGEMYDIIFMDHMMPEMDGIQATKFIRDMGYTYPIVALTANAVKGQEEIFMKSGFSGFMSKPIDINHLHSYLIRFIKDKRDQMTENVLA